MSRRFTRPDTPLLEMVAAAEQVREWAELLEDVLAVHPRHPHPQLLSALRSASDRSHPKALVAPATAGRQLSVDPERGRNRHGVQRAPCVQSDTVEHEVMDGRT